MCYCENYRKKNGINKNQTFRKKENIAKEYNFKEENNKIQNSDAIENIQER